LKINRLISRISIIISTLFGTGYFPFAPGTAGTLFAVAVYLLLPESLFTQILLFLPLLVLLTLISVPITGIAEKKLGKDDGKIVLDEFAGFFFGMILIPKKLVLVLFAFILFRIFDIFKPEPVNRLQKLKSGWGIMADDVMAGIYTNLSLQIIIRIFPGIID